jgi:hypothetical protein
MALSAWRLQRCHKTNSLTIRCDRHLEDLLGFVSRSSSENPNKENAMSRISPFVRRQKLE